MSIPRSISLVGHVHRSVSFVRELNTCHRAPIETRTMIFHPAFVTQIVLRRALNSGRNIHGRLININFHLSQYIGSEGLFVISLYEEMFAIDGYSEIRVWGSKTNRPICDMLTPSITASADCLLNHHRDIRNVQSIGPNRITVIRY